MNGLPSKHPAGALHAPALLLGELASFLRVGSVLPEVRVTGVRCEPARVRPGDLFVNARGTEDAALREAVHRGAVAVVTEREDTQDPGVPVLIVQDVLRALGHLAARVYGQPCRTVRPCGVTGSVGKATTAHLVRVALEAAGIASASFDGDDGGPPAPHRFQERLDGLRNSHAACVVEASARNLALGAFEGVQWACGVFTNMAPSDLGFHGSTEEHLDAMCELFRALPRDAVAALNRDDPAHTLLAEETSAKVVTYGFDGGDVRGRVLCMDREKTVLEVRTPLGTIKLSTPLTGTHQASSLLAALTAALAMGGNPEAAARGLAGVQGLPGRLERLRIPAECDVIVDCSRSPTGLDYALETLRPLVKERLIVVLGCSGDGPPQQRRRMARAAERWSDAIVVTGALGGSGNPMTVIGDVMRGLVEPTRALLDPNREGAIHLALDAAEPGDTVLIVGEGDGESERRVVRDWCLQGLEAEALGPDGGGG